MSINSIIRNIGSASGCPKLSDDVMTKINEVYGEDRPSSSSVYSIGNLVMVFPMKHLPELLADCNWSLATNSDNGDPLALFPDIDSEEADRLRSFLCCTADAPIAFYHRPTKTAYLSYMHHDWTIGAWFSLATHDFIHTYTNF